MEMTTRLSAAGYPDNPNGSAGPLALRPGLTTGLPLSRMVDD